MQIVSNGDNLHEMSKPVFWKNKKSVNLSSAELAPGSEEYAAHNLTIGHLLWTTIKPDNMWKQNQMNLYTFSAWLTFFFVRILYISPVICYKISSNYSDECVSEIKCNEQSLAICPNFLESHFMY